jgi:hypothetical protein
VTLGEDAGPVRAGHAPQVLAALRHAVLGLRRAHGTPNRAAAGRTHAWSDADALLRRFGLALT